MDICLPGIASRLKRAGLIDGGQARDKREQLGRESQLFGAMDGAMTFVKGDAIAGLVIVVINLLGGFSTGMASEIGKALQ